MSKLCRRQESSKIGLVRFLSTSVSTGSAEYESARLEATTERLENGGSFETRIGELEAWYEKQKVMVQEELLPRLLPMPVYSQAMRQTPNDGRYSLKPDMRPPRVPHSASVYTSAVYTSAVSQGRLPETLTMCGIPGGHNLSHPERVGIKNLQAKSNSAYSPASVGQASIISSSPHESYSHVRSPTDVSQSPSTVTGPCQSPTLNICPPAQGVETNTLPDLQIQRRS